jgi:hypothetical protein
LAGLLRAASIPEVSLIERSTLLPRASYYSAVVPDARAERDAWRQELLDAACNADLVFVDPDIGIEIPSKAVGRKGSSMYVTWQEIRGIWEKDCSILIYQHFRREPRAVFAERMAAELREHTGARFIEAIRTPYVLFLLAVQERDEMQFREAVSLLPKQWNGQIVPMRYANTPL